MRNIPRSDHRNLALEHANDDLFAVASQSAVFRDLSKLAIETIVERDRQIESLQRQLAAVKEEYRAHRERTMRASLVPDTSEPRPMTRTYTTKHGAIKGTQYIPIAAAPVSPQDEAGA